ncbi:MAG: hypothetical protein UW09_C0001G0063 [candidate division TM6 bacterium GW2011_GWF2_43_87]|nr:MAG: hypothetical protein UW09_C0001G0063 [candidate division TM6 bacterium GW2011_GWF2_43_87]
MNGAIVVGLGTSWQSMRERAVVFCPSNLVG